MNHIDTNLKFIKEKIELIKVGIFRPEADSFLQMQNNVVQIINVDTAGNVWFETTCKNFMAQDMGRKIFAYLDFNSKGFSSRLVISGSAEIVEELSSNTTSHSVLIKLKIVNAECVNYELTNEGNFFNKIKGVFQQTFFNSNHRQIQFQ